MDRNHATKKTIKNNIRKAIQIFIEKDKKLLMQVNVHEVAISHRIAVYLEHLFPNLDIDCEYNKHYDGSSKQSDGAKIRPDIIIHHREYLNAVAIFEIKKAGPNSQLGKSDIKKLKKAQKNLRYKIGVYIGVLKRNVYIVWISDGKELEREIL